MNCLLSSNSLLLIDEEPLPSNNFTLVTAIITGVLGTVIIVVLLYCFVKKKRWLSAYSISSRTTNQCNPQLQGLCEDMQDAELAQVVKKDPEIGKTIKLYHTITTVPPESIYPLGRGKTSSLPKCFAANSPWWDEALEINE